MTLTFEIPAGQCCDGETAGAWPRCPFLLEEAHGWPWTCRSVQDLSLYESDDHWPLRRTDGHCALPAGAVSMDMEAKHGT